MEQPRSRTLILAQVCINAMKNPLQTLAPFSCYTDESFHPVQVVKKKDNVNVHRNMALYWFWGEKSYLIYPL